VKNKIIQTQDFKPMVGYRLKSYLDNIMDDLKEKTVSIAGQRQRLKPKVVSNTVYDRLKAVQQAERLKRMQ